MSLSLFCESLTKTRMMGRTDDGTSLQLSLLLSSLSRHLLWPVLSCPTLAADSENNVRRKYLSRLRLS